MPPPPTPPPRVHQPPPRAGEGRHHPPGFLPSPVRGGGGGTNGGGAGGGGLALVLLLALALFAYGISWGLPSPRGWAGDEILPQAVRQAVNKGFSGGWHTKYPPFHYVLLALVQTPLRWLRSSHETLMLAGRWLSVVMALGTVWLIYRTGREIYGRRSAVFAALTTALIPPFVYFAKTANVDGPFLLWVAASFLFYIRIFDRHRLRDYVLFAVCAMLAVGTKDQAYGLYVLSPLPILISLHRHRAREGATGWLGALLDRRVLAAAGAGVLGRKNSNGKLSNCSTIQRRLRITRAII